MGLVGHRQPKGPATAMPHLNPPRHIPTLQETMTYLASRPKRFIYVHTPKHGSWLNLIETVFGKMARTFLKSIRVQSRDELKQRILQGVWEMNLAPVVFRWKKFDLALVQ